MTFFPYFIIFTTEKKKEKTSETKSDYVFLKQTLTKDFFLIYITPSVIQQLFNHLHVSGWYILFPGSLPRMEIASTNTTPNLSWEKKTAWGSVAQFTLISTTETEIMLVISIFLCLENTSLKQCHQVFMTVKEK